LREEIKALRMHDKGKELSITASLGVAQRQDDTVSLESLIESADQGLYAAKQQGRDRVCAI
jgi:diguanylate cyclase (GGDEF)-like protein